nr:hypothetical protein [Candidatus Sigynarchaeota archaeon]
MENNSGEMHPVAKKRIAFRVDLLLASIPIVMLGSCFVILFIATGPDKSILIFITSLFIASLIGAIVAILLKQRIISRKMHHEKKFHAFAYE